MLLDGRYLVGEKQFEGGLGTVYVGTDQQTGKRLLIKAIDRHWTDDHTYVIERFVRDLHSVQALNHPNINLPLAVPQHDAVYYIVTPQIEGRDCVPRHQAFGWQQVAQVGLTVAAERLTTTSGSS